MSDYPDIPEAVALALLRDIEAAEQKAGRQRRRGDVSERDRLIALYRECLAAVTGAEQTPAVLH